MASVRPGFTLIELLLTIAVIGVLAGIVIVAINPLEQLGIARDAERKRVMRETEKAQYQYLIDNRAFAADGIIPDGEANALPICRYGKADTGCVNIDALVPEYIACIPFDGKETNPLFTGYRIYQRVGRVSVQADYLEQGPAESGCENAETIAMVPASSAATSFASAPASAAVSSGAGTSSATSSQEGSVLGIRRRPMRIAAH